MLSIIVLAILTLSFIMPFVAVSAAIGTPTVDDTAVQVDDIITVSGDPWNVTSGATVEVYWDVVEGASAWLLNTTTGNSDGSYDVQITVPETPTGNHYVWVKDTGTGSTAGSEAVVVSPDLTVDPTAGLPADSVTLSGTGFDAEAQINATFYFWNDTKVDNLWLPDDDVETDEYGSFTDTVTIPNVAYNTSYYIEVADGTTNDTIVFRVGAAIELDIDEGPEGSVVQVSGRGFTTDVQINETNIEWDDVAGMQIDGDSFTANDDGEFTADLLVPTWGEGEYEINITDGNFWANASFTIDGVAVIDVDPTYGSPGAIIVVDGYNFTQIAGIEVTLDLNGTALGTVDTDANGEFTTTFTVPAVGFEQYIVNATTPFMHTNATDGFKVGIIAIIISPTSGPSGTEVTLTGVGFDEGDYNATLGDEAVVTNGGVSGDETLSDTFFVPTMDPGAYTLLVEDDVGNELSTTYTVTATTSLAVSPVDAAVGYNVTFTGENYSFENETTLTWYVYNSTWSEDISASVNYSDVQADIMVSGDGNFTGVWTIPVSLLLGNSYTINATDANDLVAETSITIVEEEVEIGPNMLSYSLGDTVTFAIRATFTKVGSVLEIEDPDGELYFMSTYNTWTEVDPWQVVQIRYQVDDASGYPYIIPSDASIGTWTWTLYEDATDDSEVIATGTIEVLPTTAAQVDARLTDVEGSIADLADDIAGVTTDLEDDIDALSSEIGDVASDVDGLKDEIVGDLADDIAAATAAANAAGDAVDDLEGSLGDLEDSVGDIADTADSAKTAADAAADAASDAATAAESASDAASGLTTLVYGAIGASLIAALAAIVSLMQISRRIAG